MIRHAKTEDMERLLEIFKLARSFMRKSGNATQWSGGYPSREVLEEDIELDRLYVMDECGEIYAVFVMADGPDPTYAYIDGEWESDEDYGVIHRVASDGSHRGVFADIAAFAREKYLRLRIDTHEDNIPMQRAVEKEDFIHRGTIYLANGDPRRAYSWKKD